MTSPAPPEPQYDADATMTVPEPN